ncbi:AvrD family protein [Paenarthrobacter sp. NPDC090520]|uniref:AvrD family protein n=1 Tax=Paenarthrobacter sp. NPDC090520 TaxID=3364382 RepID=UPI00381BD4C0
MNVTYPDPLVLNNVDDYLGPKSTRFFGSGYRQTTPALRGLSIRHTVDGYTFMEARGSVRVGDHWSVKGTTAQEPHLGTTDAIVLALEAAEALLASRYSPSILPAVYVRKLTLVAGTTPIEDILDDFPVTATSNGQSDDGIILINVEMASMKAVLELHHPLCVASKANLRTENPDALVGDAARRVYGDIYKSRDTDILDVTLDVAVPSGSATALVTEAPNVRSEPIGLEGAYQPGLSLMEAFVTTLQLGQVLLYELDGVTRAQSNTLWMRRTVITASAPPSSILDGLPLNVQLRRPRVLPLNGSNWRCADIEGRIGSHLVITCDVAHEIPR